MPLSETLPRETKRYVANPDEPDSLLREHGAQQRSLAILPDHPVEIVHRLLPTPGSGLDSHPRHNPYTWRRLSLTQWLKILEGFLKTPAAGGKSAGPGTRRHGLRLVTRGFSVVLLGNWLDTNRTVDSIEKTPVRPGIR